MNCDSVSHFYTCMVQCLRNNLTTTDCQPLNMSDILSEVHESSEASHFSIVIETISMVSLTIFGLCYFNRINPETRPSVLNRLVKMASFGGIFIGQSASLILTKATYLGIIKINQMVEAMSNVVPDFPKAEYYNTCLHACQAHHE